jgi:hypothetical protein
VTQTPQIARENTADAASARHCLLQTQKNNVQSWQKYLLTCNMSSTRPTGFTLHTGSSSSGEKHEHPNSQLG